MCGLIQIATFRVSSCWLRPEKVQRRGKIGEQMSVSRILCDTVRSFPKSGVAMFVTVAPQCLVAFHSALPCSPSSFQRCLLQSPSRSRSRRQQKSPGRAQRTQDPVLYIVRRCESRSRTRDIRRCPHIVRRDTAAASSVPLPVGKI